MKKKSVMPYNKPGIHYGDAKTQQTAVKQPKCVIKKQHMRSKIITKLYIIGHGL